MTNSGDRETYNSETKQQSYTDNYGNTHTNVTRTSESVNNNVSSYRNGYANGRDIERNYQQANLAARDNENASRGLLLGILLTSLAGLIVGAFWYFNQPRETVIEQTQPTITPSPSSDLSTPTFTPQPQQTTIIERTREVPVERTREVPVERTREVPVIIPQQSAPSVTVPPSSPQINVTVPPQQPTTSETQTTSPSNQSTDNSETAVPRSSDQPNGTSNSDSSTTDDDATDKGSPR